MTFRIAIAVLFVLGRLAGQDPWRAALSEANQLQSAGRYAEAERVLLSALDEARRLEPDLGPAATTYHNLAGLYQDMARFDAAAGAYQRSIALWEKVGPRGETYLLRTANHLVELYLECGLVDAAARHHRALIAPRIDAAGGREGGDVAEAVTNLGSIEYHQGRYPEALAQYRRALAIWERLSGGQSLELGILLNNLAFAQLRTGDVDGALESSRRALAVIESSVGSRDRLLLWAVLDGADLLVLAHRAADADRLFVRAIGLIRAGIGGDHPVTAAVFSHYAVLLKATGRKKEAATLESQAREIRGRFPPIRQTVDIRELELSLRE